MAKRNIKIGYIIAAIALLFAATMFFQTYKQSVRDDNAIKGGVTAEATITTVKREEGSDDRYYYYTYYKYLDVNGVYYEGQVNKYSHEDDARAEIGKKIEIYIDGEGNSIPVGKSSAVGTTLTIFIVLIALAALMLILFVVSLLRSKSKGKAERAQEPASAAAAAVNAPSPSLLKTSKKSKDEEDKDAYVGRFDD